MDGRFDGNPVAGGDTDDPSDTAENATTPGSPIAGVVAASPEGKSGAAASSPKRRRAVLKRVVMVPIADVEGSRLKGEAAPPSDSWAWRKYGQKPIKGSPYPRGYYRCSSSKGCPARKQVERSRVDPTMLVVTYACDHNHPWPTSRSSSSPAPDAAAASGATSAAPSSEPASAAAFSSPSTGDDDKFATDLGGMAPDNVLLSHEFSWFTDDNSPSSLARGDTILHSPICATAVAGEADTVMFTMGEEDESLFADLGELPECSVVFRRGEESQLRGLAAAAPWCGSTG